ncbi:MAG: hypothetical protein R3Y16_06930 [Rikenellaceae bacterium]
MRFIGYILALTIATSCFKDKSYETTLVVVTAQQSESGGDFTSLDNSVVYAFAADTTDYMILDYYDALGGVLTNKLTGEKLSPLAVGEATQITYEYTFEADEDEEEDEAEDEEFQDGDLIVTTFDAYTMSVEQESVMLVAVDPTSENYAYTNYTVGLNLSTTYITVSFRPWKSDSFSQGTWWFVVPETEAETEAETEVESETETEE